MADHDSPDHETAASHGRAADGPRRFGDAISGQVAAPRMLLVWDAPNMDMGLGAIIG
ncbi:MAG TPA: NYN domain-containing protein, partial [Gordonia sp. (in: high G+C Gram-positive bacteria)]|nr:NYN domain-containing protein [Gordonia sp. (in: high G+C Gram-positive bacteria)]